MGRHALVLRPSGLFRSLAHARGSVLALNRDRKGADLPVTALGGLVLVGEHFADCLDQGGRAERFSDEGELG
jgi:hypothetical protein